ncbi:MAG: hypothetical protein WCX48_11245, partial [Bacteroidales bacterium]
KDDPIYQLTKQIDALMKEDEKGNAPIISVKIIQRDMLIKQINDQYMSQMMSQGAQNGQGGQGQQQPGLDNSLTAQTPVSGQEMQGNQYGAMANTNNGSQIPGQVAAELSNAQG